MFFFSEPLPEMECCLQIKKPMLKQIAVALFGLRIA